MASLRYRFLFGFLWATVWLLPVATAAPISPSSLHYRGYVNDFAEVIEPQWKERLTHLITLLDQKTKAQVAVVTISSLEEEPIEDFTSRLFQAWGVGHKDDRGVLLLLVIKDRRSRLEVGYGLEPIIPDGFAGSVLREMRPALRGNKYGEAVYAGVSLLAQRIAAQSGVKLEDPGLAWSERRGASKPDWTAVGLVIVALLLFGALPWGMRRMGYGRRRWWDTGYSGGFGGFGSYDTSGSGGGFGGFEGFGGGSSGGGGASSGW